MKQSYKLLVITKYIISFQITDIATPAMERRDVCMYYCYVCYSTASKDNITTVYGYPVTHIMIPDLYLHNRTTC